MTPAGWRIVRSTTGEHIRVHSLVVSKRRDKMPKVHRGGSLVRCAPVTSRLEAVADCRSAGLVSDNKSARAAASQRSKGAKTCLRQISSADFGSKQHHCEDSHAS
jgi:hypothetical protein